MMGFNFNTVEDMCKNGTLYAYLKNCTKEQITLAGSTYNRFTYLHVSCMFNDTKTTAFLLKLVPCLLNSLTLGAMMTPLLTAVRYQSIECVKLCLSAGANMRVKDYNGYSVMVCTTMNVRKILIANGYRISSPYDADRKTFEYQKWILSVRKSIIALWQMYKRGKFRIGGKYMMEALAVEILAARYTDF